MAFARHGVPDKLVSDNCTRFACCNRVQKVCADMGIVFEHVISGPKFPQSNGHAEGVIGKVKSIMKKAIEMAATSSCHCLTTLNRVKVHPNAAVIFSRRSKTPIQRCMLKHRISGVFEQKSTTCFSTKVSTSTGHINWSRWHLRVLDSLSRC